MKNIVKVWYLSDNESGKKLFSQIENLKVQTGYFDIAEISGITPLQEHTNIFIFDLDNFQTDSIVNIVSQDERFKNSLKLCILSKKQIREFDSKSYNSFKLELLERPVNNEVFLLLLEKSLLVELYRDLLHSTSSSNHGGVNSLETVMEVNRKRVFEPGFERKQCLNSIIEFKSRSQEEEAKLRDKIERIHLDSSSFFQLK